ncbi:hypothetical protein [Actinomadura kijaniata]|uniref:hypothetical protein n=1 Tax=Actinomadura kijaniata TaxID=46161 RepID=UPI000A5628E4|nr:hypothetical protein [Actinomadura kijaniata]
MIVKVYAERGRWKLPKEVHVYGLPGVPRVLHADEHAGTVVMTLLPGVAAGIRGPAR